MTTQWVGPKSSAILAEVGITNVEELRSVGVVEAFVRARVAGHDVTLNFLWGLESAVSDVDWRELPERRKAELRAELESLGLS